MSIGSAIRTIKRRLLNKNHRKTVWQAFISENWDQYYYLEILKYKFIEMKDYFEHSEIACKDYLSICRDLKTCISLIDIINDHKELYDFKLPEYTKTMLINVNTKNFGRFIPSSQFYTQDTNGDKFRRITVEEWKEVVDRNPEELYLEKARRLLFKILLERSDCWWD